MRSRKFGRRSQENIPPRGDHKRGASPRCLLEREVLASHPAKKSGRGAQPLTVRWPVPERTFVVLSLENGILVGVAEQRSLLELWLGKRRAKPEEGRRD